MGFIGCRTTLFVLVYGVFQCIFPICFFIITISFLVLSFCSSEIILAKSDLGEIWLLGRICLNYLIILVYICNAVAGVVLTASGHCFGHFPTDLILLCLLTTASRLYLNNCFYVCSVGFVEGILWTTPCYSAQLLYHRHFTSIHLCLTLSIILLI